MLATVVDVLRERSESQPARHAFLFVDEGATGQDDWLSYADIDAAARRVAAALVEHGVAGQPVLLLYPPGRSYVEGFLGCLYAGAIAVPAYPPDPARLERTLPRLRALIADCGARVALSLSWLAEAAGSVVAAVPELAALRWVTTDTLAVTRPWTPEPLDPDSVALLQYTSGSTGTPKGVKVTHANLMHNSELIRTGFGATSADIGMSWLPPYHDMGLIGGILQPVYSGLPVALMSPLTFLSRPVTWLETVSRLGATISGGPNFAFDLCVAKSTPQQREQLDLSHWEVAFCGAEPVRGQTLDRFAEAFAASGFRRSAFYPCYGLAEATLIVTGGRRGDEPRLVGTHVGSGAVLGEQRLAIVDETGTPCPPRTEGEIWLSGGSVAAGYWNRPEETGETFAARLRDDPQTRYLRTGDLGFVDDEGTLAVTGRVKDLIIVRGRNVYPQDLELAVEQAVAGVRRGCAAAFGFDAGGQERVGLACEIAVGTEPAQAAAAIRQVLAEACEVTVSAVILLPPGRIPKTSSGKIQRHACRDAYLAGEMTAEWDEPAPGVTPDDPVVALVSRVLEVQPAAVGREEPVTRMGVDSLRAMELAHALREELGIDVSLSEVLGGVTPAELSRRPRQAAAPQQVEDAIAGGDFPATDGQRALWFAQRWAPESTVYQISRAARISSAIDVDALDRALTELVRRHPALRTRLPSLGGEPVRRVVPWTGPVLARHDVAHLDDEALRRRVQQDADRPMDLEHGPLFRVALYTRAETDHVLLLCLHHAITDFWSLSILVDELLQLYAGGTPPPPGSPPGARAAGEERLAYWRRVLRGAPPSLELPTTYARPRLQSFRAAGYEFTMDGAAALAAFARDNGLTLFTTLLSGFLATLARYAGEDVVTGIPTSGRDSRESRDAVGYFVEPLPVRARVTPQTTFRELAGQVRQAVLGALDHAVPFARLVEAVRPDRDPSRPALVQTMFVLQTPPAGRPDLGGFAVGDETVPVRLGDLTAAPMRLAESAQAFELSFMLALVEGRLVGSVGYCADLFDEPAVARLTRHFTTLTARAVAAPDAPLGSLDLMDDGERATVLGFARGPERPITDRTLPELLQRQPLDRTALVCGDQELSYAQLNDRADRIAGLLRRRFGIRPGSVVGVSLPRGIDAVAAFWGVLKAGGVYLPLDLDLPSGRREWMLADARPVTVLTQEALADIGSEPAVGATGIGPGDLAYLFYTSGSTGRPKGVLIEHRGACNLGPALASAVGLRETDRMLQFASCAFDAWIAEVLMAHAVGATLVITPPDSAVPGAGLTGFLAGQRVTAAIFSPSTLAALPDADLPLLRCVMSAGEACPPELARRWGRGRRFVNLYGPTETTVCVTAGEVEPGDRRPPIGAPIPNVVTYVLDAADRPVPVGVPGELCIGGIGVGRGYLGRPELTAERFRADPFREGSLYRTGDRVRWLPDGTLDFLGRIDDQVKIRGIRVEPGEVEERLRQVLGLRELAVIAIPGPTPGTATELVAYLVSSEPRRSVRELRGLLRAELSGPWLPGAFVYLDALPRTVSGKLDRRALPPPSPADRGSAEHVPPRTGSEITVAEVFSTVLSRPSVGARDHFFEELGGTSLLVAKVTSELGRRLGRDVPVTHVFEHPTVETLARRLDEEAVGMRAEVTAGEDAARARREALAHRRGRGA